MRIAFTEKTFHPASLAMIDAANRIITEYRIKGYRLTLRQLYYQFVARDIIKNSGAEYKRLGILVNEGRLTGLIDWSAIEDRGRNLISIQTWGSPEEIIGATAHSYAIDFWDEQAYRPEVWVEKEALIGVVARTCDRFRVPHFACKGYVSQSEMFEAGYHRFRKYEADGQIPIVFHFGDHDPSGIDMTRDIEDRLQMFAGNYVEVRRLALNWDQIKMYNPPPNPAKITDSRYESYQKRFGDESWELDALDPEVIGKLIEDEVTGLIDGDIWKSTQNREQREEDRIRMISDNYERVVNFLDREDVDEDEEETEESLSDDSDYLKDLEDKGDTE